MKPWKNYFQSVAATAGFTDFAFVVPQKSILRGIAINLTQTTGVTDGAGAGVGLSAQAPGLAFPVGPNFFAYVATSTAALTAAGFQQNNASIYVPNYVILAAGTILYLTVVSSTALATAAFLIQLEPV